MNTLFSWKDSLKVHGRRRFRSALLALMLAFTFLSPAFLSLGFSHESANHGISPPRTSTVAEFAAELSPDEGGHAHTGLESHSEEMVSGADHDHSAHGPNEALLKTTSGQFLVWLGKFHPAAVHFPIALLLVAALAELISMRFNPAFFRDAARFSLWVGAVGAVGAAILGWLYGGFRLTDAETILTIHRWNGTGIAALALLTLWMQERRVRTLPARSGLYRASLFVTALLVGLNGYLGGLMVYGPEQHQWPTIQPSRA